MTGRMLEINESFTGEKYQIIHLGYRYHFQDAKNKMVFRYDNTPHFPALATYPHHKHLSDRVIPFDQPSIIEAVEEAKLFAEEI